MKSDPLDRTVAVKIPRKGQLDSQETEQFLREARAAAQLHALRSLAAEDPSLPATHIALAGALANGAALIAEADSHWQSARDEAAARWQRDRELLKVAGKAREQRTARAWERLTRPQAAKV